MDKHDKFSKRSNKKYYLTINNKIKYIYKVYKSE